MECIIKPKEKEMSLDRTQKIFGIIKSKRNFQSLVEKSLAFSTDRMTKTLLDSEKQAELIRDKTMIQSRCLTRLL